MTELKPVKFGVGNVEPPIDRFGQPKPIEGGDVPSSETTRDAHRQSDVDAHPRSQHHTLGTNRNQASPGDHIHDGMTSKKLGPMQVNTSGTDTKPVLVLTGAKGGNVALTNLIALLQNVINFTDNTT